MDLKDELEAILSGAKEVGGELLTKLVNATGNPTLAQVLYDLIGSHVDVAKQVQKTPAGQQALQALQAKQAAAKAAQAPAAAAAPAPAAASPDVMAQLVTALQGINQKLDALAPAPAPVVPAAPPATPEA